ncbi:MAG: PAS domain S-box protein [Melioribacteraceae bacterium]|nr:PAS domain S-box protein [Melioribacteraceae bacterium]
MKPDQLKTKDELIRELELLRESCKNQALIISDQVYGKEKPDNTELSGLLNASIELSSTLDLDTVMQTATDHVAKLTSINAIAIYLLKGDHLYLGATTPPLPPNMPDEARWAKLKNHPHIKQAIDSRKIVTLPDTKKGKLTSEEQMIIEKLDLRSIWYIPISLPNETIGVFNVGSKGIVKTISDKELNLSRVFSSQVAIAIQNSLLHHELEKQYEQLRTTLNSIGDAVVSTDTEGRIVIMNPVAQKLTDIKLEEAKGKLFGEVFSMINSQTGEKIKCPIEEVLTNDRPVALEENTILISKNGRKFNISDSAAPILDPDGNITGVVFVFSDVTEDYRIREALKESNERWQFALEGAGDGVWDLNAETNEVYLSARWKSILGYEDHEIKHNIEEWDKRIHPDDREKTYSDWNRHLSGESDIYVNEHRLLCKDGTYKWILDRGKVIKRDEEGRPLRIIGTHSNINEKKLAEIKLERTQFGIDNTGIAIFQIEENGTINYVNFQAAKSLGYSREELIGKSLFDIDKNFNAVKFREHRTIVREAGSRIFESSQTRKDGTEFPVEVTVQYFQFKGKFSSFVFVKDLTEQKKAEEALRTSEENLVKAELMGKFGNWEIDLQQNKISGSKGAAAIYGIETGNWDLHTVQKMPLHKYRKKLDEALVKLTRNNEPYDLEFEMKRPDGTVRFVHSTAKYDEEKKKVFGVIHDITERKEFEQALIESKNNYREFFNKDLTGDFLSSVEGMVVDCNPSFLATLGFSSLEEIQKHSMTEFYPDLSQRENLIARLRKEKEVKNYELTMKRNDGKEIIVIENVVGIFDKNNNLTHIRGYLFDITDRKKAEDDLLNAKNKAEAADRMKTEFLAQMSHEIRSPLNAVLSFTGVIKETTSDIKSDELDICFSSIESASRRIIKTVDAILNMSDLQLGTYQVTKRKLNIIELVKNCVKEYESIARRNGIELIFKSETNKKMIAVDDYAMSQILVNLIDNAIKYTAKGYVEVSLNIGDQIKLNVKDTGIGISKEYLPKLFTPFSQEEQGYTRPYEGNGLGLALVRRYCNLINADISVKSKKNMGTTFTVTLSP